MKFVAEHKFVQTRKGIDFFYRIPNSNVQNSGKNGGADSTLVERFSTLDSQLLGIFVNWDTGSNPLKQFSARASYLLGFFINVDAGSNLRK